MADSNVIQFNPLDGWTDDIVGRYVAAHRAELQALHQDWLARGVPEGIQEAVRQFDEDGDLGLDPTSVDDALGVWVSNRAFDYLEVPSGGQ